MCEVHVLRERERKRKNKSKKWREELELKSRGLREGRDVGDIQGCDEEGEEVKNIG